MGPQTAGPNIMGAAAATPRPLTPWRRPAAPQRLPLVWALAPRSRRRVLTARSCLSSSEQPLGQQKEVRAHPGLSQPEEQQQQQQPKKGWSQLPATARVALFTGAYITVAGVAALLFPRQLLGLLFPPSVLAVGWVRVGATLAILFGAYYLGAAVDDLEGRKPLRMYQSTILGRLLLAAIFGALVAAGQCGPGLLLLAGANAAGAWRMTGALRSDGVEWRWGQ